MSFFDSLLGLNTADATNAANSAANFGLNSTAQSNAQTLNNTTGAAAAYSQGGMANALQSLQGGYGSGRQSLYDQNANARDALGGGVNDAVGTLQGSNANFAPWMTSGQGANGMFANSLGLNGEAGNAAATGAFQAGPGYAFQRDQAIDGAARKAASLGIAGSGNTLDAITRLSSGLADQEYGNWQNQLAGLSGQGLTAANATNGNNAATAALQYGGGQGTASLFDKLGTSLGTLGVGQGTAEGNLQSSLGNTLANLTTNNGSNLVANNWHGTDQIANNGIANGKANDSVTNTNNGIFSSLIGKGLNLGMSALGL